MNRHSRSSRPAGVANPRRRARTVFVFAVFVFTLFSAQLLRIQAFDAARTQELALTKRLVEVSNPALRGRLLDSHGEVLAASYERRTVTADQTAVPTYVVKGKVVGVAEAARRLGPLLGQSIADVQVKLTGPKRHIILAKAITPSVWRDIHAIGIPGIYSEVTATRTYPTGAAAASLVGFVGDDGHGGGGLEVMLDKRLSGTVGKSAYERAKDGRPIPGAQRLDIPAIDGADVRTTIDADLQWFAENAIARQVIASRALNGSVVVMEVATGKLRAVATYPTFDPAAPGKARADVRGDVAFEEVYEPGSTGKVMTVAAALEEKKVTPLTTVIVPGHLPRAGTSFVDSHSHGTETLTAAGVLAQSSNIGTILIGEQLPAATIESYFRAFGIGAKTGAGFPGESPGLLAPTAELSGSQRYTMLFGQGYSLNAIQATGVFQTIANGGVRVTPSVIEGTSASDGTFTPAPAGQSTRVISAETATTLGEMMEEVVGPGGTAPDAAIPGYRVAGKTGTAERYNSRLGGYNGYTASFIGFAPADKPKFVVAVTLQDPVKGSHFGGALGSPVFKEVMTYLLQRYGVPPTGQTAPKIPLRPTGKVNVSDPSVISPTRRNG